MLPGIVAVLDAGGEDDDAMLAPVLIHQQPGRVPVETGQPSVSQAETVFLRVRNADDQTGLFIEPIDQSLRIQRNVVTS